MARIWKTALAAGLFAICATCAVAQDRPRIVAVNQALQYFAEQLLSGEAEVIFPVPDGVDPSFWRPTIADISMIQSADLILLNGAGFATWIDRVSLPRSRLVNTSSEITDQFIVTESITHSHGDGGEHSHEGIASYTWLDPRLAMAQAERIAFALISRGLAPAEDVEARLAGLQTKLIQMDAAAETALADAKGVAMIATHPRYQYFARRYGLSITSLEWEAGAMPTDNSLADLESLTADLGARVLIWEAQPPQAATEAATALGLQSVVFETYAGQGHHDDFLDHYTNAISSIANAARQGSN